MDSRKKIKAIYPGSFDPITSGHIDILQRVSHLYDEVVVLISNSVDKNYLFSVEERKELIERSLVGFNNVKVDVHNGLTVDYAKKVEARVLIRGLRAVVDFEYELSMSNINKKLAPQIETVLIFASHKYYFISSRAVKEVARNGGCLSGLVPENVIAVLLKKYGVTL